MDCSQRLIQPTDCSPPGPWDSPGENTGVRCHALLQGIFLTQGSNPCLLHLPALVGRFFTTSNTWEGTHEGGDESWPRGQASPLRRPKGDWAIHSSVLQLHQSLLSHREDKYSIWIKRKVSSHSLLS